MGWLCLRYLLPTSETQRFSHTIAKTGRFAQVNVVTTLNEKIWDSCQDNSSWSPFKYCQSHTERKTDVFTLKLHRSLSAPHIIQYKPSATSTWDLSWGRLCPYNSYQNDPPVTFTVLYACLYVISNIFWNPKLYVQELQNLHEGTVEGGSYEKGVNSQGITYSRWLSAGKATGAPG